jgi:hypothetical protein
MHLKFENLRLDIMDILDPSSMEDDLLTCDGKPQQLHQLCHAPSET